MTRHLGDVIRERRENWVNPRDTNGPRGMSKTRLARRAGVALSLISRIESHQHDLMTEDNLIKVAQALGTTMPELLREIGDPDAVPPNELSLEEWLERDQRLTEAQRQIVVEVYRGLARIE